jgi:hypothetical protein
MSIQRPTAWMCPLLLTTFENCSVPDNGNNMIYKFFSWYSSTPLGWRRFIVAVLVPIQEYLFVEPCRRAFNLVIKVSPGLAIACVPLLLLAAVLTALVISLFVYEFFVGIGRAIKSKAVGLAFLVCLFAWVFVPLHFISSIGGK